MSIVAGHISIGHEAPILSDLTFEIPQTGIMAVIGRNGVGKSTLLKSLSGIIPIKSGSLSVDGDSLTGMSGADRAKKLAFVSPRIGNSGFLSVEEYVSLGRYPHRGVLSRKSNADEAVINEAIKSVGLDDLRTRRLSEMSDGEKQKASIARALAQDTPYLMLDEPTAFLDIAARLSVLKLLKEISAKKSVLFSTHDISLAAQLVDQLVILDETGIDISPCEALMEKSTLTKIFKGLNVEVQAPDFRINII